MYPKNFPIIIASMIIGCSGGGTDGGTGVCTELTDADFVGGTTLDAGSCWTVSEALNLSDGTVTIEQGVSITFATGIPMRITSGGTLTIAGTASDPVLLGTDDPLVTWQGISLTDSQGAANDWQYVAIENAGSDNWTGGAETGAAVYLTGSTTLVMDNVTLRDSESHGVIALADVTLSFTNGTFEGNAVIAHVHPQLVDAIGSDTVFTDNTDAAVRVTFGNNDAIAGTIAWPALSVPHRVEDRTFINGDLTVAPGARLEFAQGAHLIVSVGASLTAEGTANDPIEFVGASADVAGFWKGIEIESGGTATPLDYGATFDHCLISDAGSGGWSGDPRSVAAVYLNAASAALITNTTFANSAGYGLWASSSARIDGFAGNVFDGNEQTMLLHPDRVGELSAELTFVDNASQNVDVVFGNNDAVTADATWSRLEVPYTIGDRFFVSANLTLAAGVVIEFVQDRGMIVEDTGSLFSAGTVASPVVLTGVEAVSAGYWQGIRINSNTADNVMDFTIIEYAGSSTWTGDPESDCALFVGDGAQVALNDVTFGVGGGYGVYLETAASVVSCSAVTFDALLDGAIWDSVVDGILLSCP